jgi:hypothetical protein
MDAKGISLGFESALAATCSQLLVLHVCLNPGRQKDSWSHRRPIVLNHKYRRHIIRGRRPNGRPRLDGTQWRRASTAKGVAPSQFFITRKNVRAKIFPVSLDVLDFR